MSTPTTDQLCEAVTGMDSMAQGAFSEIAAIAKLALASLETPAAYTNPEVMAYALTAIWNRALDAENCINCIAEGVGCNYKNEAMHLRSAAKRKASESTTSGGA